MNQQQSRRTLIGVGALAALLLASPFVLEAWAKHSAFSGKVQVWSKDSLQTRRALAMCLLKREPGGPALEIASQDIYSDSASGLALLIVDQRTKRTVTAWLPPGRTLTPAEAGQLQSCLNQPVG